MSNFGQIALTIVGAVVGFFVGGGPMGAIYGAELGMVVGSLAFPTRQPGLSGPRISDLNTTTAVLGGPVCIVYGTVGIPGTVIALGQVGTTSTTTTTGKGGGGGSSTTYTYRQTIAVGLCEGLISGVSRIWENGLLVYDVRPMQTAADAGGTNYLGTWDAANNVPALTSGVGNKGDWYTVSVSGTTVLNGTAVWTAGDNLVFDGTSWDKVESAAAYGIRATASATYALTFTLYLGDEAQGPDPALEIEEGVGSVPGFRGLAYIVYPHRLLLATQALRHPTWRFEVFNATQAPGYVLYPTPIAGALTNYFQEDFLWVDWTHDLYYTAALTYPSTYGLRQFQISTNVELSQIPFPSPVVPSLGIYHGTVGADGTVYYPAATGASSAMIVGNGATASGLATFPLIWVQADFVLGTFSNHIIAKSLVENYFTVWGATNGALEAVLDTAPFGSPAWNDGCVCGGLQNQGFAIAFASATSGVGLNAGVFIMQVTQSIAADQCNFARLADLAPSMIDPSWTCFWGIVGLCCDLYDGNPMACFFGTPGGVGDSPNYVWAKISATTGLVLWTIPLPIAPSIAAWGNSFNQSIINGHLLLLAGNDTSNCYNINTIDGTLGPTVSFTSTATLYAGEWVYNSILNEAITGTNDTLHPAGWIVINFGAAVPGPVSHATIVRDVSKRASLTAVDVSDIEDIYVRGYALNSVMAGVDAIRPLLTLGRYDAIESPPVLRFTKRGKASVATISTDDMGAFDMTASGGDTNQQPVAVITKQTQDVELPRQVIVNYIAASREYNPGQQQSPVRVDTAAVNVVTVEMPVVITDTQAVQLAEILWAVSWAGNYTHSFTLDRSYLRLEPGDVIQIPVDGTYYRVRITDITDAAGLLLTLNAIRDDDGAYISFATATVAVKTQTILTLTPSVLYLLDLPALRDQDNNPGIYVAARRQDPGYTWPGALIEVSVDGGGTWSQAGSVVHEATVMRLVNALPAGLSTIWDDEHTLTVDLLSGSLENATPDAVINAANALAVGDDGRWEIVQFTTATLVSGSRYALTGLLRGRRGTEYVMGRSQVGDTAVLVSAPGILHVLLQNTDIEVPHIYRATTIGMTPSTSAIQFTGEGVALKPFSPVHVTEIKDTITGDINFAWIRRGRLSQELRSGADIPLSEETEAYSLDILSSPVGAVVRTINVSVQSAVYTAAQQTTDFGAPVAEVPARLYQLSAIVGRGTEADIDGATFGEVLSGGDETAITLSSGVSGGGGIAIQGYEIELDDGVTMPWTSVGNVLFDNLSGLKQLTTYKASVRAYLTDGTRGPTASNTFMTLATSGGGGGGGGGSGGFLAGAFNQQSYQGTPIVEINQFGAKFSGTDSVTGFVQPPTGGLWGGPPANPDLIQLIQANPGDFTRQILTGAVLPAGTLPGCGRTENYYRNTMVAAFNPSAFSQNSLINWPVNNNWGKMYYHRQWMRFGPSVLAQLAGCWAEITENKTASTQRTALTLKGFGAYGGAVHWSLGADYFPGGVDTGIWQVDFDPAVFPIPVNTWFLMEFATLPGTAPGSWTWAAINGRTLSSNFSVYNPNGTPAGWNVGLNGAVYGTSRNFQENMQRIFYTNSYSNASRPYVQDFARNELWDHFPPDATLPHP